MAALSVLGEVEGGGAAPAHCACSLRLVEAAQRVFHHVDDPMSADVNDLGTAAATARRVVGRALARALQALARRDGAGAGSASSDGDGVDLMRPLHGVPPPLLAACAARWPALGQALPAFLEAECRRAAAGVNPAQVNPRGAAPPSLVADLGRAAAVARCLTCAGGGVRRAVLARLAAVRNGPDCGAGARAGAELLTGEAGGEEGGGFAP